jgi:hypothetical protein
MTVGFVNSLGYTEAEKPRISGALFGATFFTGLQLLNRYLNFLGD